MTAAMTINPSHPRRLSPLPPDLYARVLKIYQKCVITKMVNSSVSSYGDTLFFSPIRSVSMSERLCMSACWNM